MFQLEDLLSQILKLKLLWICLNAVPTPTSHPGSREGQYLPRVSVTSSLQAPLRFYTL